MRRKQAACMSYSLDPYDRLPNTTTNQHSVAFGTRKCWQISQLMLARLLQAPLARNKSCDEICSNTASFGPKKNHCWITLKAAIRDGIEGQRRTRSIRNQSAFLQQQRRNETTFGKHRRSGAITWVVFERIVLAFRSFYQYILLWCLSVTVKPAAPFSIFLFFLPIEDYYLICYSRWFIVSIVNNYPQSSKS